MANPATFALDIPSNLNKSQQLDFVTDIALSAKKRASSAAKKANEIMDAMPGDVLMYGTGGIAAGRMARKRAPWLSVMDIPPDATLGLLASAYGIWKGDVKAVLFGFGAASRWIGDQIDPFV